MPRFEFTEGTSNKFWEIEIDGASITTHWGRIGTKGQTKTKEYDSADEAQAQYEKQVASKTKKGYQEVEAATDDAPGRPVNEAVNPELEAPLLEDPNDIEAAQVYGDWLEEHGDPRGELITLQVQYASKPTEELRQASDALIERHADHFLGELTPWTREGDDGPPLELTWALGYIKRARVRRTSYDDETDVEKVIVTLLRHPSAKFIQELVIGMIDYEGENYYQDVIDRIAEAGPRPTMRKLFIGDFDYPDEIELSWSGLGGVTQLWKSFPNLEEVTLQSGEMDIGDLDLPRLKKLRVITGGLDAGCQAQLCKAKWPALEELEVWFGSSYYGFSGGVENIDTLLEGTTLPSVKRLRLKNAEFTDELAQALPAAKVLEHVEELDLSMGTLTGSGLRAMLENADAFSHLKKLDLSNNYLTPEECDAARSLAQEVLVLDQKVPDEWDGEVHRYVSVGE